MDLTVIVPIYNTDKYLPRCLNSIIYQTKKVDQIILIDDGSTDSSKYICEMYMKKYDNITFIHQENKGTSSARNLGLSFVKTTWVTFVDSDDYIDINMYEQMMNLKDEEIDIISSRVFKDKKEKKFIMEKDEIMKLLSIENMFSPSVCDKIFRTCLFEEIKFPEGRVFEDLAVIFKLFYKSRKSININKEYYHYKKRIESNSSSNYRKKINKMYSDNIKAWKEQMIFYKKYYPKYYGNIKKIYLRSQYNYYKFFINQRRYK